MSAGISYQHGEHLTLDAGYAHLFIDDPKIQNTEFLTEHTQVGTYAGGAHIFSAQASYRF